jgi:hypothetical protein
MQNSRDEASLTSPSNMDVRFSRDAINTASKSRKGCLDFRRRTAPATPGTSRVGAGGEYTVKKVIDFPVPGRDVTYQTLPGREKFNYSRPGKVWQVTPRLGTVKFITSF